MKIAEKIAATISPGRTSGSMTRHSTPTRVQPSTSAASSSSRGISSKKPIRIQIASGRENATYGRISPR